MAALPLSLFAGPGTPPEFTPPPAPDTAPILSENEIAGLGTASPIASPDPASRLSVETFYREYWTEAAVPPIAWTGSDDPPDPGSVSPQFLAATLRRLNAARALAGLPGDGLLVPAWNQMAQEAAFVTSRRDHISHQLSPRTPFYTPGAGTAAARSNILLGATGPEAVDLFLEDPGPTNHGVGHRRWLLYPGGRYFGLGALPFRSAQRRDALVIWVVGGDLPMPARRLDQPITWPAAGWFPRPLLPARWSLSFPAADFAAATVALEGPAGPLPVSLQPLVSNLAEPTLVWRVDLLSLPSFAPDGSLTLHVNVAGARVHGRPAAWSYSVHLFLPAPGKGSNQ